MAEQMTEDTQTTAERILSRDRLLRKVINLGLYGGVKAIVTVIQQDITTLESEVKTECDSIIVRRRNR